MKTKKPKKFYYITVQFPLDERPLKQTYKVNGMTGTIIKIKKIGDKWLVDVKFKTDSMIKFMVEMDETVISRELH